MEDEAHADQRYLLEQLANLRRQLCDEAVTCPADELQDLPDRCRGSLLAALWCEVLAAFPENLRDR
jgi:hypothetical protein